MAVVLGVAIGSGDLRAVALAGLAAALAEAISMGGVLYTATRAERDLRERDTSQPNRPSHDLPGPVAAGLATLASALVAGAVPLAPFVVLPMRLAAATSVVLSLGALFVLGGWKGRVTRTSSLREGLRFLAVGGFAALAAGMLGVLLRQPTA